MLDKIFLIEHYIVVEINFEVTVALLDRFVGNLHNAIDIVLGRIS